MKGYVVDQPPELIKLFDALPVDHFPPVVDVDWSPEGMLQVVGMLPDVDHQQRPLTNTHWGVLIGCQCQK